MKQQPLVSAERPRHEVGLINVVVEVRQDPVIVDCKFAASLATPLGGRPPAGLASATG
jgi:hypothetical protein